MTGEVVAIRNGIIGADRAFHSGGGGGGGTPADPRGETDDCPIQALGHADGVYWFLDFTGQPRKLSARDIANRAQIISLFGGDDSWPRKHFPKKKEFEGEDGQMVSKTIDFVVNAVAQELIARASRKGLWGKSITLRLPGIWRGDDGLPVVHCGDKVLMADTWQNPGFRTGKQIWVAAESIARPAPACGPDVARRLQDDLQSAWSYKDASGGIAIIGLLYSGWVCGALDWRLNGFVTGPTGSGKTALMRVIRAAWPEHDYSNDTSKAGMEQTINGRAVPVVIDEASDRNQSSGRDLLDMTLAASGDDGAKQARGTVDGKGRMAEIICSIVMFSIYPPPLQPQHMGRFVLVELEKPEAGADNRTLHRQIAEFARTHGRALWGRAIAAFERYRECLNLFRAELAKAGCSPREMDSKGALLAGWYVMTNDGMPGARDLQEGIAALGGFLVTARQAEEDDAPQRALQHLLASQITLHRSTDRKPIAELLELAFAGDIGDADLAPWAAADQLARNGIRPVLACGRPEPPADGSHCRCPGCWSSRVNKPVPRNSRGAGVWIATRHPALEGLFKGTDFDDRKWLTAIARARDAASSGRAIRIGSVAGYAVWLPRDVVLPPDDPL